MIRGRLGLAALLFLGMGAAAAAQHPVVHPERASAEAEVSTETLRRLEALGYAEWTSLELAGGAGKAGVVFHDPARAYQSLHLYKSRPRHEAHLMDMGGRILHTWRASDPTTAAWDFVELDSDGRLLASAKYEYLEKLDWDSSVLWKVPIRPHHDLDVAEDGRIYALARSDREVAIRGETFPIRDDDIVVLSPEGAEERRVRLSSLFADRVPKKLVRKMRRPRKKKHYWDVFHTNSIEILDRDVPGVGKRGHALLSIRELNLIAVVDLDEPRVVRTWGDDILDRQHHATVVEGDRILLFDNGRHRRWSRVLEIDPASGAPSWELRGKPPSSLYTGMRGSTERLPNGNTMVVESAKGRVFEVTRDGDVVWEFFNPDVTQEKGKKRRAAIYRMPRIDRALAETLPVGANKSIP